MAYNHDVDNGNNPYVYGADKMSTTYSLAKIFLYMFIGLFITAVVALGLGYLLSYLLLSGSEEVAETTIYIYLSLTIVSAVAILILQFVVHGKMFSKKNILAPTIAYTILMGILLSSFTVYVPWQVMGMAFGITSLAFLIMSLIAFISKGNMSGVAIAGLGLLFGAGLMYLGCWVMTLFLGGIPFVLIYVFSFVVLAAVMLLTIWDLRRIKETASNGEMSNNLSLYCAFILYLDFVYIFIRILRILILIFSRNR